jgi:hypothetical protein
MRVGHFVSFGLGGSAKVSENLIRGLNEIGGVENVVFYADQCIPRWVPSQHDVGTVILSRQANYAGLNPILVSDLNVFNNYHLDVMNTVRSGGDFSFMPNFEAINWNFKVVESNFAGGVLTKADIRVYPSNAAVRRPEVKPYVVIPNPINAPQTTEDLRAELGISPDTFVFGRLSRPDREIYCITNLSAYKRIENDKTMFVYVGACKQALVDIQNLGIKRIKVLDCTIDEARISRMYNTFDVLCHSNCLGETFGNTIAEGMIHGKPVVSHIGDGISWAQAQPELLGMPELFITSDILNNYTALMFKLMIDEPFYDRVSKYVKERADTLFDYRQVARKYLEVYNMVTEK